MSLPDYAIEARNVVKTYAATKTTPQPLQVRQGTPQYHGPLELLSGPQRLETGWLEGEPALRDYYMARSSHAGRVWVYRDRLNAGPEGAWYLHGIFG